jgi:SAM-dependent methyltransferase
MDLKEYTTQVDGEKMNHPWEYARFEVVSDILKRHLTPKYNSILDVGCGDGFFLEQLSANYKNMRFVAVDIAFDDEMIEFFSKKYQKSNVAFYKEMPSSVDGVTSTDAVLLLDVIEHIEDDITFLKGLAAEPIVGNDTLFMISVPAYQGLFCSHDVWLGHYRRYTTKMLQEHANQAGLEIVETGYFFKSLLLPRMIQVLKEKMVKPKLDNVTGIGDWKGGKTAAKIMKSILVFDYQVSRFFRFFGLRLPGLSCYAVCKKKTM